MPRYIDAANAADIISDKMNIPLGDLVDVFAEIPTADVAEVKHGYWVPHKPMIRCPYSRNYDCSECGNSPIECGEYCNKCGAKMDGERKELNDES